MPAGPRLRHAARRLPARPGAPRLPARRALRGPRHRPRARGRGGRGRAARSRRSPAAQRPELEERGLAALLRDVELPLVGVLRAMEQVGIALDLERLADDHRARVARRSPSSSARSTRAAGEEFLIGSPQQLGRDPLRQARAVAQAARQDRLLDRRARARGDPRRARDRADDRALARAARRSSRPTSSRCPELVDERVAPAHDVPADGRRDRAALVDQPEPPERARSARRSGREIRGCFVAGPGLRADLGRLLAGRAAGARRSSPTSRC